MTQPNLMARAKKLRPCSLYAQRQTRDGFPKHLCGQSVPGTGQVALCTNCLKRPAVLDELRDTWNEAVESSRTKVLEQRCEHKTPWDLAILACARVIEALRISNG